MLCACPGCPPCGCCCDGAPGCEGWLCDGCDGCVCGCCAGWPPLGYCHANAPAVSKSVLENIVVLRIFIGTWSPSLNAANPLVMPLFAGRRAGQLTIK